MFTRADGQSMDADTLTKAFRRLVATAKVTPITLHGLRDQVVASNVGALPVRDIVLLDRIQNLLLGRSERTLCVGDIAVDGNE